MLDYKSIIIKQYALKIRKRFSLILPSSPFLSVIYKFCHWDLDKSYLVYGVSYPKKHLVDYELEKGSKTSIFCAVKMSMLGIVY